MRFSASELADRSSGRSCSESPHQGDFRSNENHPHLWQVAALTLGRVVPGPTDGAQGIPDVPRCLERDMIPPSDARDPLEGLSYEFVVAFLGFFYATSQFRGRYLRSR